MTWAITCSFASSHGISLPLHQINSLALMAIEALLEFVAEWFACQRLRGHFRPLAKPDGVAMKTVDIVDSA